MAVDYTPFVEMAQELIAEYGQDVTWQTRVTVAVGGTPWEPDPSTPAPVPHVVKGVPFPMNTSMLSSTAAVIASMMYEKGEQRARGDVQMLLPGGLPFEPKMQDTCICSEGTLKVVAVEKLAPGAVPVLWWIQLGY